MNDYQPSFQDQPNPQFQPEMPEDPKMKNYAIAALVCGILGLVGDFIPLIQYFTIVFAILAVVFGYKAMKALPVGSSNRGMAIGGLVCGIVALACWVLLTLCFGCVLCGAMSVVNSGMYNGMFY